jgi:hypothetical protein
MESFDGDDVGKNKKVCLPGDINKSDKATMSALNANVTIYRTPITNDRFMLFN